MFVPLDLLAQEEARIETPEDVVKSLDRWILPLYKEYTTSNPLITKIQCMRVLQSFQAAGKLHVRMKPSEISRAVDAFLEDRLWVSKEDLDSISSEQVADPEVWVAKPTIINVLRTAPRVMYEAVGIVASLLKAMMTYYWYLPTKDRDLVVPKVSIDRTASKPILTKKDN